ncbi:hypothetical protein [Actinoplanes sp. NPDC020271]|uniref:hypothetical protein n=1 Tax=Actinoplanes sp. NPDC020271 TaxID=3363896 RepID=UPI00379F1E2A
MVFTGVGLVVVTAFVVATGTAVVGLGLGLASCVGSGAASGSVEMAADGWIEPALSVLGESGAKIDAPHATRTTTPTTPSSALPGVTFADGLLTCGYGAGAGYGSGCPGTVGGYS